jgi:hypothetical protein
MLTDDRAREKLLFDDSQFSRSKHYFAGLQLLRISSEWINETRRGLLELRHKLGRHVEYPGIEPFYTTDDKIAIIETLDSLQSWLDTSFESLLERIRVQREMVEGLRDGVSDGDQGLNVSILPT